MRAKFVFEKFTDESDPIHDMGVGHKSNVTDILEKEITELFKKHNYIVDETIIDKNDEEYIFYKNINKKYRIKIWMFPYWKNYGYTVIKGENDNIKQSVICFTSDIWKKHIFNNEYSYYKELLDNATDDNLVKFKTDKLLLKEIENLIEKTENIAFKIK
jgi:hypothetical protein